MNGIYILQVTTGREQYFCTHARKLLHPEENIRLIIPKREMWIRKQGKMFRSVKPIFPGYVFISGEQVSESAQITCRRCPGYIRFLNRDGGNLKPVSKSDRLLITQLINHGEVAGLSKVTFDKNKRIRALSGPLLGCEGKIIKVDRRKQRAKVKFLLNGKTFLIDFQYEEIELLESNQPGA